MDEKLLTIQQAIESLKGTPGLVFGPLATTFPSTYELISETILQEEELEDSKGLGLPRVLDDLMNSSQTKYAEVKQSLVREYEQVTANNQVNITHS